MTQFESFSGQLVETISLLQEQLDELSLKQQHLRKIITDSRDGSLTEEEYADVKMMMDRTSAYNSKLLSLRTTMVNMSLKSKQLRKRSDKLKATKLDYLSKVESIRKLEQERDLSIAAKISDSTGGGGVLDDQRLNQLPSSQSPSPSSSSPVVSAVSSPKLLDNPPLSVIATTTSPTHDGDDNDNGNGNGDGDGDGDGKSPAVTAVPLELSNDQRTVLSPTPTTATSASTSSSPLSPPESATSSGMIAMAKTKKKKRPKAREVEIGGDDDGPAWIPKRTFSAAATQPKKP